jgi:hypothetical protein
MLRLSAVVGAAALDACQLASKQKEHEDWKYGGQYLNRLLAQGHPLKVNRLLRMSAPTFEKLSEELAPHLPTRNRLDCKESVAMLLSYTRHRTLTGVKDEFHHSTDTIFRLVEKPRFCMLRVVHFHTFVAQQHKGLQD